MYNHPGCIAPPGTRTQCQGIAANAQGRRAWHTSSTPAALTAGCQHMLARLGLRDDGISGRYVPTWWHIEGIGISEGAGRSRRAQKAQHHGPVKMGRS